jgi:hypothetical protein
MALSSLSVVTNANRLRRSVPPALPSHPKTCGLSSQPSEVGTDHERPTEPVTDPVCGMTVDPATAVTSTSGGADALLLLDGLSRRLRRDRRADHGQTVTDVRSRPSGLEARRDPARSRRVAPWAQP